MVRALGQDAGKERQPEGLEQDFLLRVWDTAEGLLPTSVRSITQTRDGYVWLASFDGMVRFDGVQATLVNGKNTHGLPLIPKAGKVFADSKGRLWAASTDGKVFSFDQVSWREYRGDQGWPGFVVEGITENAAGRLVFSGDKSLVEFVGGRFVPMTTPEFPAKFRPPLKAVFDRQGKLWLTSPSHIWREDAGHWTEVYSPSSAGGQLRGVTPARDSGLWVATSQELRKYVTDATPVKTLARPDDFQRDDLELLEDFHGNLWAGSVTNGLRIWMHDGRLVSVGTGTDSLSPQVLSLFEDRERNVLVGTNGAGLARFKPRPFNAWFGQLGGLAGVLVDSVGEDSTGRILVATEGSGLRWLRGEQAGLITNGGVFSQKGRVTSLLRTRDGKMIAAVPGKGLFSIEGDTPIAIPAKPLDGELVRALFEDSRGRLWIGHDHGIVVRDHGEFTPISSGAAPVLTNVRGIAEGPDGTLWFVGKEGLAHLVGDKLELVTLPAVVSPRANLLSIFIDHAGVRWIGVESKGILRWEGEHAFIFDSLHGLPITSPGAFLREGDFLWVSGEKGIVRINRASLEAVAAGKSNRLELQLFNRADGLPSDACRRGYQPTAFQSSDGHLWFATHKGAISVRPREIVTATYEPPATIEEIRAELNQIIVTPANQDHIDIPAGTRHMTIRCSVPSLGKPDYVRFQYKLEGFDNFWTDAGNERVIRFYDLQPATYRFFVRAVGTDGRLVEKRSSITFIVHPFFWQEWWFRALCLTALVVGVAYVVWRSQQRHIRLREEKLCEQEARTELEMQLQQAQKMDALGRLAGGIAHDFNNLLTSVGGNAELLVASLPPHSPQRELVDDISTAAGRARELVSQILTFSRQRAVEKVALDPAPVFREAVQLLRAGLPAMIELHAELPEKLPPILGDASQLQRVLVNLGTNSAHAIGTKTGHIWVRGEESEITAVAPGEGVPSGHYVRLVVRDDGRGMDDKTLSRIFDPFFTTKAIGQGTGLGLSVVHGIVEAYGGHIQVESQPAIGTIFRIYFPVTDQQPAPMAAQPELPVASAPAGGGVIMLVDDEAVVLKVTRAMLERLGYVVEGHTDSLAAVAAFTTAPERYRLLLTDYAMPKLDGVELARAYWEIRPDFPAILYSGYGGRLTSAEAERLGFVELLAKPFTMQMLEESVARALKPDESAMAESRQT
jgi:signal transduction histidine kinase/ligand-binding sensor domain-containing protein/ActR/RegA family two-component response regulator